jgi:PAS domain-containing protein
MAADKSDAEAVLGEDLGSLLDAVVEACLLIGFDGQIVSLNCAAERMFGWPSEKAVGADMGSLLFSAGRVAAIAPSWTASWRAGQAVCVAAALSLSGCIAMATRCRSS